MPDTSRDPGLGSLENTVNVAVELSSFGRPKEEKLKPHLRPLREAATITWSKHSLGYSQPSQPGSQRGQPATHHRQRETSDVRELPEDIHSRHGDTEAKRIVHSALSTISECRFRIVLTSAIPMPGRKVIPSSFAEGVGINRRG
ncbi:hypothetical protein Taro_028773 [Colocasia esculenta]|uniref:Uncharacterized protein n=1 Tax=Colocasia esculenta TaxID=4460 RepID=A0A843VP40_COLES|nr:hypothetical protein [Colocasia esculenta]